LRKNNRRRARGGVINQWRDHATSTRTRIICLCRHSVYCHLLLVRLLLPSMTYLQTVVKPERLLTTAHTCLFELYSRLHLPGLYTTSWNLSSLSTPHTAQQRAEANSEKLPIVCGVARIWRSLIGQKWRIHRSKTSRYRTPQVLKPPRVRILQRTSMFVIVNKAESPTTISRAQKPLSQCTNLFAVECYPRRTLGN
jgi:hypothetical protein